MAISRELLPPKKSKLVVWELKLDKRQSVKRVAEALIAALRDDAAPWLAQRDAPGKLLTLLQTDEEFRDDDSDTSALAPIAALSAAATGDVALAVEIIDNFSGAWQGTDLEHDRVVVATRERLAEWRKALLKGRDETKKRLVAAAHDALRELKLDSVISVSAP